MGETALQLRYVLRPLPARRNCQQWHFAMTSNLILAGPLAVAALQRNIGSLVPAFSDPALSRPC